MVKTRHLLATLIVLFVLLLFMGNRAASAQTRTYHINQEWAEIWINQDGTIDLFYNISITLDLGPIIKEVYVGQPNPDFNISESIDQYGHLLTATDASSGTDYKVNVTLYDPLSEGQTIWFTLLTNVGHMVYEDTQTNVGMKFIPTSWEEATVTDLRVLIVLPPNVTKNEVQTLTGVYWNGTPIVDDRQGIYFEKQNLAKNATYPVGVSFPKQYVQHYDTRPTGLIAFFQQYGTFLVVGIFVVVIGAVVVVVRKKPYKMPRISMETLGIKRGLTAVEASYILDMKPSKIVTEILYSLLQKRAIWVESTKPSLKLKIMPQFHNKTGTTETPLRYYEIDFLEAIKADGRLSEERLAQTVTYLTDTVEQKLHGYCRRDTIDYYRKIVSQAWEQVERAGTPDIASKAYDEQLLWLFLDPNFKSHTQTAFRDRAFEPSPLWLWYWYGYQHYHPHPTYTPNVETPAQAAKPPTIPGSDFANNIATAVENTSNNIVANLEKFANAIIPTPSAAKTSHEPARHGATCVCACAACACACACVSCACACAGGGVG